MTSLPMSDGPGGSTARRLLTFGFALAVVVAGMLVLEGCSSTDTQKSPYGALTSGPDLSMVPTDAPETCDDAAVRECHVTISVVGDVANCYQGQQTCREHTWSACADGSYFELDLATALALRPNGLLALSAASDCLANPCNPHCRTFVEVPDEPIETVTGVPTGFRSGDPDSVPPQSDCQWGADCQDNEHCVEPFTSAGCDHSKCVQGTALGATCRTGDACVEAICSASPSCCSVAWDAGCVADVKTVCDADCGETISVPCEHHACDEGVALTCANDCVASVCALDLDCCVGSWDSGCVALATAQCGGVSTTLPPALPPYANLCGYAVYAYNDLYLGQKSTLSGVIGAGGNVQVTQGNLTGVQLQVKGNLVLDNSTVAGRAVVSGNVEFRNSVTFSNPSGTPVLEVGGTTTIQTNGSRLTGNVISTNAPKYGGTTASPPVWTGALVAPAAPPDTPRPVIPTKTGLVCNSSLPSFWANPGDVVDLAPGNYGSVGLNSNSSNPSILRLHEGSYTFYSLTFNSDAKVEFDYGATGIDINVCQNLSIAPRTLFSPQPASFRSLRWYYGGTSMKIDQQGGGVPAYVFPGMLIAPNANVEVAPNTQMQGVVYAKSLRFEPGLMLLPSSYATEMCGSPGTPTCDAGIDMSPTPSAIETGACEPWLLGAKDSACAGFDIGLGVPCEDSVVVCNHGMDAAPAGIRLAFFDTSYPWADTSPDTSAAGYIGDCFTTESVPAGLCISQRCDSALLDRDLWVVAIPPSSGASECSTLGNWAHYLASETCACFWGELLSADIDASEPGTCRRPLGTLTDLDLGDVDAIRVATDGAQSAVAERAGLGECGDGWYLDGSDLVLCPATCASVAAAPGSRVKISAGCATVREPVVMAEVYESDCEPGTMVQWDMVIWRSITPLDSTITFEARTADSEVALALEAFEEIGVARNGGGVDTQLCDPFNLSDECPVLFYTLVEAGVWDLTRLRRPVLELMATLSPASGDPRQGPVLEDWQVQFTCIESE